MGHSRDKQTEAELAKLSLRSLFRFAPPTQEISKLRQSLLVKQLSDPAPRFSTINELASFLDDRTYEHSNAALNIIFSYTGDDLRALLENDQRLRIEVGSYQKFVPKQEVEEKTGRRHIPAHHESTPVFDQPTVRSLLKGKNRSNLTLLLFKLLFNDYPKTPQLDDFKIICDVLNPKFRTIDYGLLLNYAAQPAHGTHLPERYYHYLHHLKSGTVLLQYLMEHQATHSARRLHQAFFNHFLQTIQEDSLLGLDEKSKILQLSNLCFAYSLLADKELIKSSPGFFAETSEAAKHLYQALKQLLEKPFLFAKPDPLNTQYLDNEASQVLSTKEGITMNADKSNAHFYKKIQAFHQATESALNKIQPASNAPGGNSP